jgi:serine/threonine protein kinase
MQQFGPYSLLKPVGSGGMAEVFLAEKQALGTRKRLAIKLIAPQHVGNKSFVDMFLAEARMSMELGHSCIVQVHEVGEIGGRYYMAMEWVHGLNLAELTKHVWESGERISPRVAGYVIGEVLRALDFSHTRDVIHRDVSPQNVMLSTAGEVKLMDFGIARLASEETSGLNIKGKVRYMPPEQVRGQSHIPAVDLFAVGAMLHELAASERFRGLAEQVQLLSMAMDGEVPDLQLPPDWPEELEQLRRRLLRQTEAPPITKARDGLRLLEDWSGYRNASYDLGELVARFVQSEGGLMRAPPAPHSWAAGGSSEPNTQTERLDDEADPEQVAPTQILPNVGATAIGVDPEASSEPKRRANSFWVFGLGLASLGCLVIGIYGVGAAAGWWTHDEEAVSSARDNSLAPAPMSTIPTSAPMSPLITPPMAPREELATLTSPASDDVDVEPDTEARRRADLDEGATAKVSERQFENTDEASAPPPSEKPKKPTASVGDESTTPSERSPSEATRSQPAAIGTADVAFVASPYFYLQLRVDKKKVLELAPGNNMKLEAGTHRLEFRQAPTEDWTSAGEIDIEAGKRYKVKMTSPPTVTEL